MKIFGIILVCVIALAQVEIIPHKPYGKECFSSTFDPKKSYQIGDKVDMVNSCQLDGDTIYYSLWDDNKGNDPRALKNSFLWHETCGICGVDEVLVLLNKYRDLREKCTGGRK